MKNPVKIGSRNFSSKKEALTYYKAILNLYDFGQSLNDNDYNDLLALLNYEYQISLQDDEKSNILEENYDNFSQDKVFVKEIRVAKVQFKTKCFEILLSDKTSYYISYIMLINRKGYTQESLFATACRNSIQNDLIVLKQKYFRENSIRGEVKCQETGSLSKWGDLAVDHRQPNTLSVIIDRFKELNAFDLDEIEYQTTKSNLIVFKDSDLLEKFVAYHREKATLRVVRKECNSSRSAMARVRKGPKDLVVSSPQLSLF